jgi:hypothetical protein
VIVGVALELIVVAVEYARDRNTFKEFIEGKSSPLSSPEKPHLWKLILELAGVALVVAGVWGEFDVHILASHVETRIRDASRQLVSIAEGEAASANREAAQLRKDAEGLRKRAEDEAMARVRIEQQLAWRVITPEQERHIGAGISSIPPTASIRVHTTIGNPEAFSYGYQLADILHRSGFANVTVNGDAGESRPVFFVLSRIRSNDLRLAAERHALWMALHHAGIPAMEGDQGLDQELSVFKGSKPLPRPITPPLP